jgi:predicted RNase H-like nuclease
LPEDQEQIIESHPEGYFRVIAGDELSHTKITAPGYAERLTVLSSTGLDAASTLQSIGAGLSEMAYKIGVDDVLDAVALATTASLPKELQQLSGQPLLMQMAILCKSSIGQRSSGGDC